RALALHSFPTRRSSDLGLVRERQLNNSGSLGFDPTTLGFPASLKSQYEALMFPRFDVAGFTSLGTQFFTQVNRANTTQSLAANRSEEHTSELQSRRDLV